jgi:uncharacterized membrane protein HdeD (DUF308 family)
MLKMLFKNWWMILLKGTLLIIFGILAFLRPGITMTSLVIWFAAFMIADGVISLAAVISNWNSREDKWLLVAEGALGVLLGILIFRRPVVFEVFIAYLIGFWAIFSGISKIAMAIQLRKEMEGEGWLVLSGIMSILFGIIIFAQPMTGIATLMWIAGTFAVLVGILMIFLSLKLRRSGDLIERRIKDFKSDPLT